MIKIGIHAPNTQRTRNIISALINQLNLLQINMQEPLTRALAALLNIDIHELINHTEPHRHYHQWGANVHELERRLCLCLRTGNPHGFMLHAEQRMGDMINAPIAKLINGFVITGIQTGAEANWLRNQGGTLLHICDPHHRTPFDHLPAIEHDIVINAGLDDAPFMQQLITDLQQKQQEAA